MVEGPTRPRPHLIFAAAVAICFVLCGRGPFHMVRRLRIGRSGH